MSAVALGTKAIGEIVKMNVDGVLTDFVIVHKGKPSEIYDDSCNGIWVRSNVAIERDGIGYLCYNRDYETTDLHVKYMSQFITRLDENIRPFVNWVKIPYGSGKDKVTIKTGADGLLCQAFALSFYEMGFAKSSECEAVVDGVKLDYFDYTNSRSDKRVVTSYSGSTQSYHTRTPTNSTSSSSDYLPNLICYVKHDGSPARKNSDSAVMYYYCPAMVLSNDLFVSDDGTLTTNQPPTIPADISYGSPRAGRPLTLTTSGATDPENDAVQYVWESRTDADVYHQIGVTTEGTITDTVPTSGNTYQARVKAVDAKGSESGYMTGAQKAISYNTDPVISGADQDLGSKTEPFTVAYTVTDQESDSQTLKVTESVTNGEETILLREYIAAAGTENTADLSDVWVRLLPGEHTLTIRVSDGADGFATRTITFSRAVTRLAASRCIATDQQVSKVFLSFYPSVPQDAAFVCQVTNNPFDETPVWEDVSDSVGRLVHTFANTTVTAETYGLAYRFQIAKGAETVRVRQVTIRFA